MNYMQRVLLTPFDIVYYNLTSAIDEDGSCLIETRIEVSLKGSNILGQMNKLVQVCPNVNEAWKNEQSL
jgi:hypothetical protein